MMVTTLVSLSIFQYLKQAGGGFADGPEVKKMSTYDLK